MLKIIIEIIEKLINDINETINEEEKNALIEKKETLMQSFIDLASISQKEDFDKAEKYLLSTLFISTEDKIEVNKASKYLYGLLVATKNNDISDFKKMEYSLKDLPLEKVFGKLTKILTEDFEKKLEEISIIAKKCNLSEFEIDLITELDMLDFFKKLESSILLVSKELDDGELTPEIMDLLTLVIENITALEESINNKTQDNFSNESYSK